MTLEIQLLHEFRGISHILTMAHNLLTTARFYHLLSIRDTSQNQRHKLIERKRIGKDMPQQ
jgi:hypothetical protein